MQIKQPSGVKLILSEGTICPLVIRKTWKRLTLLNGP